MKKKTVNPKVAMFVSTTIVAIVFGIIVILLENLVFTQPLDKNASITYLIIILLLSFIEMKIID